MTGVQTCALRSGYKNGKLLYGKAKAALPPFCNEWMELPRIPKGTKKMTAQGQALAEYGLCTFDEAHVAFENKQCAACRRPYMDCKEVAHCSSVPPHLKEPVAKRFAYLNVQRSNKSFEWKTNNANNAPPA